MAGKFTPRRTGAKKYRLMRTLTSTVDYSNVICTNNPRSLEILKALFIHSIF